MKLFRNLFKKPEISPRTKWQIECFLYLINKFGADQFNKTRLIRPTDEYFSADGKAGSDLAAHYFEKTKLYSGMSNWKTELIEVESDENLVKVLSNFGLPGRSKGGKDAAGSFCIKSNGDEIIAEIRYAQKLIARPVDLIATFSHELAHYLASPYVDEIPGGEELHEHFTDLVSVYMGFGIFQIRSCFRFERYNDGIMTGHSVQRQGYLSRPEFAIALAIFTELRNIEPKTLRSNLDDDCWSLYSRAIKLLRSSGALKTSSNESLHRTEN